jgi:hypothetical protein
MNMQKFRLTGLLWEFARYKFAINCKFIRFLGKAPQTPGLAERRKAARVLGFTSPSPMINSGVSGRAGLSGAEADSAGPGRRAAGVPVQEKTRKLNDHRLKAVGFLAAESRIGAKAP